MTSYSQRRTQMDDILQGVNWSQLGAGAVTLSVAVAALRFVAIVTTFAFSVYKDAAVYSDNRVDGLVSQVAELTAEVGELKEQAEDDLKVRHGWRSIASSLYLEREQIYHVAVRTKAAEVVQEMDHLTRLREGNAMYQELVTRLVQAGLLLEEEGGP